MKVVLRGMAMVLFSPDGMWRARSSLPLRKAMEVCPQLTLPHQSKTSECNLLQGTTRQMAARFSSRSQPENSKGDLPRFYVENIPAKEGTIVRVLGDEFWHITRVLRIGIGDRVELFDGKGGIVEGSVAALGRASVDIVSVDNKNQLFNGGPHWHVAVASGSLKGGRGDWMVEKCVELGATSLIPLLTERSAVMTGGRHERWHRIVLAATKQCQRLHLMNLRNPLTLKSLVTEMASFDTTLMAEADSTPIAKVLHDLKSDTNGLLIIGPEGDFSNEEKEVLVRAGAVSVGLGCQRLRVETATLAILSAVMILSDAKK